MKNLLIGTFSALAGIQAHASGDNPITVKELEARGINASLVSSAFKQKYSLSLTRDDILTMSYEEEGGNLRFDTLDHLSVVVPIFAAKGSENKVWPGP